MKTTHFTDGTQGLITSCKNGISFKNMRKENNTLEQVKKRMQYADLKSSWVDDNFVEVVVSDHALDNWNGRVGPIVATKQELAMHLTPIFSSKLKRYAIRESIRKGETIFDTVIEIDKDIVLACTFETNKVIIVSCFGRISETPALANWYFLRHYNYKKGRKGNRKDDQVNLSLPLEVLEQKKLPSTPTSQWVLAGKKIIYLIEKYYVSEQKQPVYLVMECHKGAIEKSSKEQYLGAYGNKRWFLINTAEMADLHITNRLRLLLQVDGQKNFVKNYRNQLLNKVH